MHARLLALALVLVTSACGSGSPAPMGADGGGVEPEVDPITEDITAAVDVWEEANSAYIEFGCDCRGVTCLGLDFWRPFAACVNGLLGDNDEARQEFADVAACYAEGFTEAEACVETTTCETVSDDCGFDRDCVYDRCDVGLSDTLEVVYAACRIVGGPGGFRDEDCL